MKKVAFRILVAFLIVLSIVYLLGPHPATPFYSKQLPELPTSFVALEQYVQQQESKHPIKKDNQAEIVWYDTTKKAKTPYSIVYLHGFSASKTE